jgi:prepilin-type N-terminal cleavage/methylation domain-containing protein
MLRPNRKRDRKRAAFTLLEMVIVLGVIGTLAAMAMPSIVNGVWQQRQASAAQDLARFMRGVRDMTRRSGVAHNMTFAAADNSDLGRLEVWMGANNRCRLTDWADAYTHRGTAQGEHMPVMTFDMARYNPLDGTTPPTPGDNVDTLVIRVRTVDRKTNAGVWSTPIQSANLATGELCFEPAGDVYFRAPAVTTGTTATDVMNLQHQLIQFAVVRLQAGSTTASIGVDRHVIVNPSGVARIKQ